MKLLHLSATPITTNWYRNWINSTYKNVSYTKIYSYENSLQNRDQILTDLLSVTTFDRHFDHIYKILTDVYMCQGFKKILTEYIFFWPNNQSKKNIISEIVTARSQSVNKPETDSCTYFCFIFSRDFEFLHSCFHSFVHPKPLKPHSLSSNTSINLAQFFPKSWPALLNLRSWLQFFRVRIWGQWHCDSTRSKTLNAGAGALVMVGSDGGWCVAVGRK